MRQDDQRHIFILPWRQGEIGLNRQAIRSLVADRCFLADPGFGNVRIVDRDGAEVTIAAIDKIVAAGIRGAFAVHDYLARVLGIAHRIAAIFRPHDGWQGVVELLQQRVAVVIAVPVGVPSEAGQTEGRRMKNGVRALAFVGFEIQWRA